MSDAELRRKDLDSFNDHQKDNRNRATQLVNYAFLLAGGTFTASVSIFSSRPKEQITAAIANLLHIGWYNLFLSTVAFFTMLLVMILRDYFVAEVTWRPRLGDKEPYLKGRKFTYSYLLFELTMFAAGIFGYATLCFGLYKIMHAAFKLVS